MRVQKIFGVGRTCLEMEYRQRERAVTRGERGGCERASAEREKRHERGQRQREGGGRDRELTRRQRVEAVRVKEGKGQG